MPELTLDELAERSGEDPRRIRFLVEKGLLEGANRRGPKARYPAANVARMALIERYKDRMTLDEIRQLFLKLGEDGILALIGDAAAFEAHSAPLDPGFAMDSAADYVARMAYPASRASFPPAVGYSRPPAEDDRPWSRRRLHPDLEIHYRLPSLRAGSERVEELLRLARELFSDLSDTDES